METRIVLVDDHRIVREGLRALLQQRAAFSVVGEAANGDEAVKIVARQKPDLVIIDIALPGLSGIEVTREILAKAERPPKVLVLSMHESSAYVEQALRAGAMGYVLKDSAAQELFDAIEAVCGGASYLSPAVTQRVVHALAHPDDRPSSALRFLSDREREVLTLVGEGLSSKEIARELNVSLKTVESHRANLMEKLKIHKLSGLVRFAIRVGLVAP